MRTITARFIYLDPAGFTYTRGAEGFITEGDYRDYLARNADRILAVNGAVYDDTEEAVI